MSENNELEEFTESLKKYLGTNYGLIKLEATERYSVISSELISGFVIAILGMLFLFFISLGAGFYFSKKLGDDYSGFLIVAGFYFLLTIIFIIGQKKIVEEPIRDKIIRKAFSNN